MSPDHQDATEDELNLKQSLAFVKHSAKDFLAVKAELFAMEIKEVVDFTKGKLLILLLVILCTSAFYLMFWVFCIGLGSVLLNDKLGVISEWNAEWLLLLLFTAVSHVVVVLLLILKLGKKSESPFFTATKSEFKRDKQWLEKSN